MGNYTVLHLHSDLSSGITNIDSVTKFQDYIIKAKELHMRSLAFTEHGNFFEWYKKKKMCEENGIKYIHGVEVYITSTLNEKIRDNLHTCLYARNWEGVKELNRLVSISNNRKDNHFYYVPRISIDEFCKLSDNIIVSTACLGGVLAKGDKVTKEKYLDYLIRNKNRCFLEIQHHLDSQQISYNQYLYELSQKTGLRLITGTDTHALNEIHLKGRIILQKAKGIYFENEEGWDLTFKSYEDLIKTYEKQNSLPMDEVLNAIENTNLLSDMVEEFKLDKTPKYPKLYKNANEVFKNKVLKGVNKRGVDKLPNFNEYKKRVNEEFRVYKSLNAVDYMLLQTKIIEEAQANGIKQGYGRGSVNGSIIAYLLGITEIDSIKFDLNFFRFLNPDRQSMADIDVDFSKLDREWVRNYIFNMSGIYAAEIITFNTIADKGAIRDVGRALDIPLNEVDEICKSFNDNNINDNMRIKYKELFEYVDIIKGTIVSIGTHPSGILVSPIPLDENIGLCTLSTTNNYVSMLMMKELDELSYVKLDVLGLDNIGIINDTCQLANIDRLTPDNINLNDEKVWKSIRDDSSMIFQMESSTAQSYLKQLFSDDTITKIKEKNPSMSWLELFSFANGAIRPSGASFRDVAASGEFKDNGFKELNEFLYDTLGYCLLQEQIMLFLVKFCGYSMAESDNVRRGIAKKVGTEKFIPEIKQRFLDYSTKNYNISIDVAEKSIESFLQVILDASSYGFSKNHNTPYSITGYACGWLREYYPLEFCTACLNAWKDKEDKTATVISYLKKREITINTPKFRYSKGEYFYDKETNAIYQGIGSLKGVNKDIGDKFYNIKEMQFESFVDVLQYIKENRICNTAQVQSLIKINFFGEYGSVNYLLGVFNLFETWYEKKMISKSKVDNFEYYIQYGEATEKTIKNIRWRDIINDLSKNINPKTSLKEVLMYEHQILGYCNSKFPNIDENIEILIDLDEKYTPKATFYNISTGKINNYKVYKKTLATNSLTLYDITEITNLKFKNKVRKVNDEWVETDEKELVLIGYKVRA